LEKYEVNVLIIFLGRQFDFQRPKAQCGTGNSKTGCYFIVVVSLYIFYFVEGVILIYLVFVKNTALGEFVMSMWLSV